MAVINQNMRKLRLDESLPLGKIEERVVDDKILFIDPQIPSWIALSLPDADIFRRLIRREPIGNLFTVPPVVSREQASRLVTRIISANFLNDRIPESFLPPIKRIQIHLTNRCNLRCIHCYMDSGVLITSETEAEQWCTLLTRLAERHSRCFLSVSGGEPLLSKALFPVLEHARRLGMKTAIITNGILLKGKVIERLKPLIDVCAISFDGLSPETHDFIRGHGNFAKTYANLIALRDVPFRVGLNITALKTNRDELVTDLRPFVDKLPFEVDIDLASLTLEGRGIKYANLALDPGEFRALLTEIAQAFVVDRLGMHTSAVSRSGGTHRAIPVRSKGSCGYGDTLTVYSNGDVSPCITPRFIRGNIFKDMDQLLDVIGKERDAAQVDRLEECKTCVLRYVCGGRCHLTQLRKGQLPSQVECPQSYKDSMLRNLVQWSSSG